MSTTAMISTCVHIADCTDSLFRHEQMRTGSGDKIRMVIDSEINAICEHGWQEETWRLACLLTIQVETLYSFQVVRAAIALYGVLALVDIGTC